MCEVTQEQFDAASSIFDQIRVLRDLLTKTKTLTLEGKLILRRRIVMMVAQRREILGMTNCPARSQQGE